MVRGSINGESTATIDESSGRTIGTSGASSESNVEMSVGVIIKTTAVGGEIGVGVFEGKRIDFLECYTCPRYQ